MEPGEIAVWRDAVDTVERRAVAAEAENAALTEQVADHKRNAAILGDKLRRTTEGFQAEAGRLRERVHVLGSAYHDAKGHKGSFIECVSGWCHSANAHLRAALAPAAASEPCADSAQHLYLNGALVRCPSNCHGTRVQPAKEPSA